MSSIEIRNRRIGSGEPVYFIAEIGINHNGDLSTAKKMIEAVARTGADAVKFQSFKADKLADPSKNQALYDIFKLNELAKDDHVYLRDIAHENNLAFISTPFDEECAVMLKECGADAIKIASGDLTNNPLLKTTGSFGIPIIISTGMGYMNEVVTAIEIIRNAGAEWVLPLHCVSSYPPHESELNLRSITVMCDELMLDTGFSDHYIGDLASITAITLGAVCIEKHFTLDKNMNGPDHKLSADEGELRTLIEKSRLIQTMLGDGVKKPSIREEKVRQQGRQGVYAAVNIRKGSKIEKKYLKIARPEGELSASRIDEVIGKSAATDIKAGTSISIKFIETRANVLSSKCSKITKRYKIHWN